MKIKCVQVSFDNSGREYTYSTDADIKAGTLLVVKVNDEYKLVYAVLDSCMMEPIRQKLKKVAAIVDVSKYEAEEALKAWREKEMATLARIAKERMARKTMRDMFADDPELLARFDAISNTTQILE